MKITIVLFVFFLIYGALTLPSSFDLRVQPSLIRFADYSLKPQGTCVAHAWGQQLAQIVSNAFSLQMKSKIKLSSQHLIECISSKNQICHDASLQNIHSALQYIQKHGITTVQCIRNRLIQQPRQFCPRQCEDGYKFPYQIKAKITKHQNFNEMLTRLTADQVTAAFVIIKVYNSMNFYSSQKPKYLGEVTGDVFQYRVGQVVGWKSKGQDIIVRLGSGQGWGYNGFGNLNLNQHKNLIQSMYTLNVLASEGMKIQKIEQQLY